MHTSTTKTITTRIMMTSTKTAIIPPKMAPKTVAVLSLPDDDGSFPPWEGSVVGGCVTISPVKESNGLTEYW